MKLRVIGFWGGFPAVNEATSGYLLEEGNYRMLIDCGSAVLSKLQETIAIEELDSVILSHYHHDHIADIGPLQFARHVLSFIKEVRTPLPIYGHTLDRNAFDKLTYKEATKGLKYEPNESLTLGPFTITFLKTIHPVPCFAMRITNGHSTVVYTADSSYQDEFITFSKGADLLISESSFYSNQDGTNAGHMTSVEAANIAEKAGVKHLLLTHLPHYGDHEMLVKDAKDYFKGQVTLARTGFEWCEL
ncbi:MBL fold metallo-hydrolase [Metabacillus malikii]|uniref:Ribonuclease BN (tRNA processing enzyme) n=1 Tax=Metabacillus malikii TaxID=1504265 RepID=A0ABT9ZKC0_9BACI|nr:MBL fold metallo-hydrolase [Metabacillus malikii]MDQ0232222.1 ribonuclease BN (tRNA processing enzyme) [Metabacillus malikii]